MPLIPGGNDIGIEYMKAPDGLTEGTPAIHPGTNCPDAVNIKKLNTKISDNVNLMIFMRLDLTHKKRNAILGYILVTFQLPIDFSFSI